MTFLADYHKNVRKELPNWYHVCPFICKILLSEGAPFYTHELSYIFSENVSKIPNSINMTITVVQNIKSS